MTGNHKGDEPDATVTPIRGRRLPPPGARTERQKATLAKGAAAARARGEKRRQSEEDGPSRWEMYLAGKLPVSEWDDAEIGRMRTKDWHGNFSGRSPALKPHMIREIKAEAIRRGDNLFMRWGQAAIKVTAQIMMDPTEKAADRLRAAETFMNRCYGKVPEQVKVSAAEAWREDIDAVFSVMGDEEDTA